MAAVPKEPLLNASIILNGVDMSRTANEVSFEDSAAKHDTTTFQGGTYTENTPGLKTCDVKIGVFQDYTAGSVHQTCAPLYRNNEKFTLVVKPDSGAVAADNPAFCMVGGFFNYSPIGAKIGDPQSQSLAVENRSHHGFKEFVKQEELEAWLTEVEGEL